MSERLIAQLAAWLVDGPVMLARVTDSRGATPRRAGARMLISAQHSAFSVGGGEAESRVIEAARRCLAGGQASASVAIDLSGGADSAGVCGGSMQIALQRWAGAEDLERARAAGAQLAQGLALAASDEETLSSVAGIQPDPRLLILGGGHCGEALYDAACLLEFDLQLYDPRPDWLDPARYPQASALLSEASALLAALDSPRQTLAVLLSRDLKGDIDVLRLLARRPPDFIGMMGSRRRIAQVRQAVADCGLDLARIHAPIGLEIEAETPAEIAISILAQLIAWQRRAAAPRPR